MCSLRSRAHKTHGCTSWDAACAGQTAQAADAANALLVTVGDAPEDVVEEFFKNPESRFHMVGSVPVDAARTSRVTPARSTWARKSGVVSMITVLVLVVLPSYQQVRDAALISRMASVKAARNAA